MNNTSPMLAGFAVHRFGWPARLGLVAGILAIETVLISILIERTPAGSFVGPAKVLHDVQHWAFRFVIAYAVLLALLIHWRGPSAARVVAPAGSNKTLARIGWGAVHLILFLLVAALTVGLYGGAFSQPFAVTAVEWHTCALAATLALLAAIAPLSAWRQSLSAAGALPLYVLLPAAIAVLAIRASQELWTPTARLTFRLVQLVLTPVLPSLRSDPATSTLITDHFAVTVSEACSGLEGMGLMLVFCATWLWVFRREYYFPRALIIAPLAVLLIFCLNVGRIAALVLIANAGHQRIASIGFHSQAGWIAFNFAALGVAILARRNPWWHRDARDARAAAENPVAPYLLPLLAILAAGMVAHALSEGFDFLYPLRLIAAAAVLIAYRHRFARIDWSFSWRAPALGAVVFCIWIALARVTLPASSMPAALASAGAPARIVWIACHVLASVITVPIAEELAYRGFLLRRLVRADFESVAFKEVHGAALALCAIVFGITHGGLWLPGIIAGLGYGLIAVKTGKLGEAVIAHATTNGLLAVYVLEFGQWQFW